MRARAICLAVLCGGLALWSPSTAAADEVVADDLIVDGSQCVGPDCVDGEDFGFDTLRLKGPDLRLGFRDTSLSSNFPSNDWEFTVNDLDAEGTESFFAFTDLTAGTSPLRILGGAPDNAVQIPSTGSVMLDRGPLTQRVTDENIEFTAPADGANLRQRVANLPILTYEFQADPREFAPRHIGPTASDFHTTIQLGAPDDGYLAPSNVAGVALAVAKEISAQVDDLTGPQGPPGPKGDPGPAGPAGEPAAGLTAATERLAALESKQKKLNRRNRKLRKRTKKLRRQVRTLKQEAR